MPAVRMWDEVHYVYKQVADKHQLTLSHLVNILLLVLPVECPGCVAYALQEGFEMKSQRAREIMADLREKVLEIIQLASGAESHEKEEALCKEG